MDSTGPADRRAAHLRVGAAATAAFLALLLWGLAARSPAAPARSPAPAVESTRPDATQPAPVEPQQGTPDRPGPDFDHDRDGNGPPGDGRGPGFGGGPDGGPNGDGAPGGSATPAPATPAPSTDGQAQT